MRIGVCQYSFAVLSRVAPELLDGVPSPRDWVGLMDLAAAFGLAGVERHVEAGATEAELDRIREEAAARSMRIVVAGGRVANADGPALLRAAHRLGAATVRMTLSSVLEGDRGQLGPGGWSELLEAAVDRLREWRPIAEELGVSLAIENHQDAGSEDLVRLCERVGGDRIGVTLDTGNPLAVGEDPLAFARRVAPFLKNAHLKDYQIHRSASGFRLVRCALGAGVVDFPALFALFDREAPDATRNIELGATRARHIRLLEPAWWEHFPPRDVRELLPVLQLVERNAQPADADWRTPHEREAPEAERVAYELCQFRESVEYLHGMDNL